MPSGRHARALLLLPALVVCSGFSGFVVGCSDTDPRYGTPGAIVGRHIDYPSGSSATDTDAGAPGGATTPVALFGVLYDGAAAGDGIKSTCIPCHAPGGSGGVLFVSTGAADAYKIFQSNNYKDLTVPAPHGFFTKGAHTGPALTATQKAAATKWSQAESAGGGATGADAGDAGP